MAGRTVLVTGASAGIGRAAALALGGLGAHVVLACRHPERGRDALRAVQEAGAAGAELLLADLSEAAQVRRLAAEFGERPLHVLVNNAGILEHERRLSADGIELTWATNVLAYFLLTALLLDRLRAAAPARVINVASELAGGLDLDDVQFERRRYRGSGAYSQSKQADRMLTWAQARRLDGSGVTANAMHPGTVKTALLARFGAQGGRTPAQGADTIVWLASRPELAAESGHFWMDRHRSPCRFRETEAEERLFTLCETMTRA
jgi:NAD(P)-dependent dehydrogenase (short-subunit alcohol dehydrogenase family)